MKVKAKVSADRERPAIWREEPNRQVVSVSVEVTIDAARGEPVVGSLNAALDGARRVAVESIRSAS